MLNTIKIQFQFIKDSIRTRNLTQVLLWLHNLIGFYSFYRLGKRMQSTPEGLAILQKRPRLTLKIVDGYNLYSMPKDSFGYRYISFMEGNGLNKEPASPPPSPLENELTAYAKARWRETHDYRHVLTGFSASLADEAIIAAFQFGNLPNSWSFLVMIVAPIFSWKDLNPFKQWFRMIEAFKAGRNAVCLGSVDYEAEFETPLTLLRENLNVKDLSHLSSRYKHEVTIVNP
jgi:ubiquinone biosynthesis protein COQ4